VRSISLLLSALLLSVPTSSIANTPPIVDAGESQTVFPGISAQLDGSATDPEGDEILDWLWTLESQPPTGGGGFDNPYVIVVCLHLLVPGLGGRRVEVQPASHTLTSLGLIIARKASSTSADRRGGGPSPSKWPIALQPPHSGLHASRSRALTSGYARLNGATVQWKIPCSGLDTTVDPSPPTRTSASYRLVAGDRVMTRDDGPEVMPHPDSHEGVATLGTTLRSRGRPLLPS